MIAPRVDPVPGRTSRRVSKKRSSDASAAAPPSLPKPDSGSTAINIDAGRRQEMIRKAAYFRAQQRGFAAGQEIQDWLAAEQQVDGWLNGAVGAHER